MDSTKIATSQVLRGVVLQIVRDAEPLGASTEIIRAAVKQHGYELNNSEITTICNYLKGKHLIRLQNLGNAILKIHREIAYITPQGIDATEGTLEVDGIVFGG